ncbi:MAG: patatin-like phospholipase family protein [Mangrovibacterium sp.]
MKITDFIENPSVVKIIEELKRDRISEKEFSDIVDEKGNQYVELVQEGGGVLGVALVGYTYVLEQMGIRFLSLAGTSAGSINAMLLAGLGDISQMKSQLVIEELVNKNLFDFVDGDDDAKDFIDAIIKKARRVKLIWKGWQVLDDIFDHLGLNPGNDFTQWLKDFLKKYGITSQTDLENKFCVLPPDLKIRKGINKTIEGLKPRLAIISAELNTETKVEFPVMAKLYWKEPQKVNPAIYVRASMSIPYFFEPLKINHIPQGKEAKQQWEETVKYCGPVPKEVFFVDGGIMSNFPINVFHKINTVPRLPTFGIRLGVDRNKLNQVSTPLNLFGAMFNSIRHLHDYDFILKNPDYSVLIGKIDIGDHDWLNFAISEEAKVDLFRRGAETAAAFLRGFDWKAYKKTRAEMKIPV